MADEIIIPIKTEIELDLGNSTRALESLREEAKRTIAELDSGTTSASPSQQQLPLNTPTAPPVPPAQRPDTITANTLQAELRATAQTIKQGNDRLRKAQDEAVLDARRAGVSWKKIADALGQSEGHVNQRYKDIPGFQGRAPGNKWQGEAPVTDFGRESLQELAKIASLRVQLRQTESNTVEAARRAGLSWDKIGSALDVTRAAAHARFSEEMNQRIGAAQQRRAVAEERSALGAERQARAPEQPISGRVVYHGSSQIFNSPNPDTSRTGRAGNLVGPGFYTSDTASVSGTYAGEYNGSGVFRGIIPDSVKLLDLAKQLPKRVAEIFAEAEAALTTAELGRPLTPQEHSGIAANWQKPDQDQYGPFRKITELYTRMLDNQWDPTDEVAGLRPKQDFEKGIIESLQRIGYGGFEHPGGVVTGFQEGPHTARVVWDASQIVPVGSTPGEAEQHKVLSQTIAKIEVQFQEDYNRILRSLVDKHIGKIPEILPADDEGFRARPRQRVQDALDQGDIDGAIHAITKGLEQQRIVNKYDDKSVQQTDAFRADRSAAYQEIEAARARADSGIARAQIVPGVPEGKVKEIGRGITEGLASGGTDSGVINPAAITIIENFVNALREAAQTHSPSQRPDVRAIGKGLVEGVAVGGAEAVKELSATLGVPLTDEIIQIAQDAQKQIAELQEKLSAGFITKGQFEETSGAVHSALGQAVLGDPEIRIPPPPRTTRVKAVVLNDRIDEADEGSAEAAEKVEREGKETAEYATERKEIFERALRQIRGKDRDTTRTELTAQYDVDPNAAIQSLLGQHLGPKLKQQFAGEFAAALTGLKHSGDYTKDKYDGEANPHLATGPDGTTRGPEDVTAPRPPGLYNETQVDDLRKEVKLGMKAALVDPVADAIATMTQAMALMDSAPDKEKMRQQIQNMLDAVVEGAAGTGIDEAAIGKLKGIIKDRVTARLDDAIDVGLEGRTIYSTGSGGVERATRYPKLPPEAIDALIKARDSLGGSFKEEAVQPPPIQGIKHVSAAPTERVVPPDALVASLGADIEKTFADLREHAVQAVYDKYIKKVRGRGGASNAQAQQAIADVFAEDAAAGLVALKEGLSKAASAELEAELGPQLAQFDTAKQVLLGEGKFGDQPLPSLAERVANPVQRYDDKNQKVGKPEASFDDVQATLAHRIGQDILSARAEIEENARREALITGELTAEERKGLIVVKSATELREGIAKRARAVLSELAQIPARQEAGEVNPNLSKQNFALLAGIEAFGGMPGGRVIPPNADVPIELSKKVRGSGVIGHLIGQRTPEDAARILENPEAFESLIDEVIRQHPPKEGSDKTAIQLTAEKLFVTTQKEIDDAEDKRKADEEKALKKAKEKASPEGRRRRKSQAQVEDFLFNRSLTYSDVHDKLDVTGRTRLGKAYGLETEGKASEELSHDLLAAQAAHRAVGDLGRRGLKPSEVLRTTQTRADGQVRDVPDVKALNDLLRALDPEAAIPKSVKDKDTAIILAEQKLVAVIEQVLAEQEIKARSDDTLEPNQLEARLNRLRELGAKFKGAVPDQAPSDRRAQIDLAGEHLEKAHVAGVARASAQIPVTTEQDDELAAAARAVTQRKFDEEEVIFGNLNKEVNTLVEKRDGLKAALEKLKGRNPNLAELQAAIKEIDDLDKQLTKKRDAVKRSSARRTEYGIELGLEGYGEKGKARTYHRDDPEARDLRDRDPLLSPEEEVQQAQAALKGKRDVIESDLSKQIAGSAGDGVLAAYKTYFAKVEGRGPEFEQIFRQVIEETFGAKGTQYPIDIEDVYAKIDQEKEERRKKAERLAGSTKDGPAKQLSLGDEQLRAEQYLQLQEEFRAGGAGRGGGGGGRDRPFVGPPEPPDEGPPQPPRGEEEQLRAEATKRVADTRRGRLVALYEQQETEISDLREEATRSTRAHRLDRQRAIYQAEEFLPGDAAAEAKLTTTEARNKAQTGVETEKALTGTIEGVQARGLDIQEQVLRQQRIANEQRQLSGLVAAQTPENALRRRNLLETEINKALEARLIQEERNRNLFTKTGDVTSKGKAFFEGDAERIAAVQREQLAAEEAKLENATVAESAGRIDAVQRQEAAARQFAALNAAKATGVLDQEIKNERLKEAESAKRRVAAANAILSDENGIRSLTAEQQILQKRANQAIAKTAQELVQQQVDSGVLNKGTLFQRVQAYGQARKGNVQLPDEGPKLGQFLGQKLATTAGFLVSGSLLYGGFAQLKTAIEEAEQLQVELTRLQASFESTDEAAGFPQFRETMLSIARDTGVAASEVVHVGLQLKGAFRDMNVAAEQTRAAIELSKVSGLELREVTDSLTATSITFDSNIRDIGNKALSLQESTGVLASQTIEFLGQIAPVADEAGISLEQIGAFAAVAQERSGRAGGAIAEGFNRVLPAIETNSDKIIGLFKVLSSPPEIQFPGAGGKLENRTLTPELIQQQLSAGKTGDVLIELAASYNQLSPQLQKVVISMVGGRREAQNLLAVFSDYPGVLRAYTAQFDSAGKLTDYFAEQQKTMAATIERVKTSIAQIGEALLRGGLAEAIEVIGGTFIGLLGILRAGITVFAGINDATQGWAARILGLVVAMRALIPLVTLASKAVGFFSVAKVVSAGAVTANAKALASENVQLELNLPLQEADAAATGLTAGAKGASGAITKTGAFGRLIGVGRNAEGQIATGGGLARLVGLGGRVGGAAILSTIGITAGLTVAVAGLGYAIKTFNDKNKQDDQTKERLSERPDSYLRRKSKEEDDRTIGDKIFGGKSTPDIAKDILLTRAASPVAADYGAIAEGLKKPDEEAAKALQEVSKKIAEGKLVSGASKEASTAAGKGLLDLFTGADSNALGINRIIGGEETNSILQQYNKRGKIPLGLTPLDYVKAERGTIDAQLPKELQKLTDEQIAALIEDAEAFTALFLTNKDASKASLAEYEKAQKQAGSITKRLKTDAETISLYQLRDASVTREDYIDALTSQAKDTALSASLNTNPEKDKKFRDAALQAQQSLDQALAEEAQNLTARAKFISQIKGEGAQSSARREMEAAIQNIQSYQNSPNPDPKTLDSLVQQYVTAAQAALGGSSRTVAVPKNIQRAALDTTLKLQLGIRWKELGTALGKHLITAEQEAVDLGGGPGGGGPIAGLAKVIEERITSLKAKAAELNASPTRRHPRAQSRADQYAIYQAEQDVKDDIKYLSDIKKALAEALGFDLSSLTSPAKDVAENQKALIDLGVAGSKDNRATAQAAIDKARIDQALALQEDPTGTSTASIQANTALAQAFAGAADVNNNIANAALELQAAYQGRDAYAKSQTNLQLAIQKYNQLAAAGADPGQLQSAAAAIVEAQRAAEDAFSAITDVIYDVAIALDNLHGDKVKASNDQLAKAKATYERLKNNGSGDAEVQAAYVQYLGALRASRDAKISDKEADIEFQLHVKEISTSQAIAQYKLLLAEARALDLGKDVINGLRSKIYDLQHTMDNDLQFNLPSSIRLPTLYEAKRFNQSGGNMVDNRNYTITLNANSKFDTDAALNKITEAINAPPRFGNRPRTY